MEGTVVMKVVLASVSALSLRAAATGAAFSSSTSSSNLPPNHPKSILGAFGSNFRCPHAKDWMIKGPERAAADLGLAIPSSDDLGAVAEEGAPDLRRRRYNRLLEESSAGNTSTSSSASVSSLCDLAPGPAGAAHQAAHSDGYLSSCPGTPGEGSPFLWPLQWTAYVDSKSIPFQSDEVLFHSKSRVFYRLDRNWKRSDTHRQRGIQRSIGQSPCPEEDRLDPDSPEGGGALLACRRNSDDRRTMIHRGSKMYFITWKNGTDFGDDDPTNIDTCTWLDLGIVGNVRPDWFMDDRGDSTDVQYLGNQHIYYNNEPLLVKQWRKKDFASQYFVMSMLGNPGQDGIHWPMTLNVPGEGFGDDFLQMYTNHSLLTDADDGRFLLDQALEAAGGSCPEMERPAGSIDGPPTGLAEHIPSNLEVDPASWCPRVHTFSPVWEPPELEDDYGEKPNPSNDNLAIAETEKVTVGYCHDSDTGTVHWEFAFRDVVAGDDDDVDVEVTDLPWMAIAYREDEECLMTPRGGGDGTIILVSSGDAYLGSLPAAAKSFEGANDSLSSVYRSLTPLDDADGYEGVSVSLPKATATAAALAIESSTGDDAAEASATGVDATTSTLVLSFKQKVEEVPDVVHLSYAIGNTPALGYHSSRMCFAVGPFPPCSAGETTTTSDNEANARATSGGVSSSLSMSSRAVITVSALAGAFFAGVFPASVL